METYDSCVGAKFQDDYCQRHTGKRQLTGVKLFIARINSIFNERGFVAHRKLTVLEELPVKLDRLLSEYTRHCAERGNNSRTVHLYENCSHAMLLMATRLGLGYLVMLSSLHRPQITLAAALMIGLGGSMYTVQSPLLVQEIMGSRHYSSIGTVMMMGNNLASAFSYSPIGLFYYQGAFVCAIIFFLTAMLISFLASAQKGRAY